MGKETTNKIVIESVRYGKHDGTITGVSLPIPEPCPKGIRNVIAEQIFIPGTEIRYYLADEGVVKKIPASRLEKAKRMPLDERRKLLDELMEEIQFADRLIIEASRDQVEDL